MIAHHNYTQWNIEKNSSLNEIQTHNLCNTSAVLYQQSYSDLFLAILHLLQV